VTSWKVHGAGAKMADPTSMKVGLTFIVSAIIGPASRRPGMRAGLMPNTQFNTTLMARRYGRLRRRPWGEIRCGDGTGSS
jgi:hypothetical protein